MNYEVTEEDRLNFEELWHKHGNGGITLPIKFKRLSDNSYITQDMTDAWTWYKLGLRAYNDAYNNKWDI